MQAGTFAAEDAHDDLPHGRHAFTGNLHREQQILEFALKHRQTTGALALRGQLEAMLAEGGVGRLQRAGDPLNDQSPCNTFAGRGLESIYSVTEFQEGDRLFIRKCHLG